MEYGVSDGSGRNADTDDDLPPSNQNRIVRGGRVSRIEQSSVIPATYSRMPMEAQIHHLEQEAYHAVLRAFEAQSGQLSWDKLRLLTELRKELRVSDDEDREMLTVVSRRDQWRDANGQPASRSSASHSVLPCPTISVSRKRQKTSQMMAPGDLQWEGEGTGMAPAVRLRGPKGQREILLAQNGIARKLSDDIVLLNTKTLVKEVEKVFGVSDSNPFELEKAKRLLIEHEQALVDAIARLAGVSDGESDGELQFLHGASYGAGRMIDETS